MRPLAVVILLVASGCLEASRPLPSPVEGLPEEMGSDHVELSDARGDAWNMEDLDTTGMEAEPDSRFDLADLPQPDPNDWELVWVGSNHVCATTFDGAMYCWGGASFGRLGIETDDVAQTSPIKVDGIPPVRSITGGPRHTCALDRDGRVHCWGHNGYGQIESPLDGNPVPGVMHGPTVLFGEGSFDSVTARGHHTCALGATGAKCRGDNSCGQLAAQDASSVGVADVPLSLAELAAGFEVTCGIDATKQVICWGREDNPLVNATSCMTDMDACPPMAGRCHEPTLNGTESGFHGLSVGWQHACAIREGSVWCWGSNNDQFNEVLPSGKLGVNPESLSQTSEPVESAATGAFRAVSAGVNHTCALSDDRELSCWGLSDGGEILGATGETYEPVVQLSGRRFVQVSAGNQVTCAIEEEGQRLWCWGLNDYGQLASATNPVTGAVEIVIPDG